MVVQNHVFHRRFGLQSRRTHDFHFEGIIILDPRTSPPRYFFSASYMLLRAGKSFFTSIFKVKNRRMLMVSPPLCVEEWSLEITYSKGDLGCTVDARMIFILKESCFRSLELRHLVIFSRRHICSFALVRVFLRQSLR